MSLTVAALLQLPELRDLCLVGGAAGTQKAITGLRTSAPEPGTLPGSGEFVLLDGHALLTLWDSGGGLLRRWAAAGAAGVLVAARQIPADLLAEADGVAFPVVAATAWEQLLQAVPGICRELNRRDHDLSVQSEQTLRSLTATALEARSLKDITQELSRLMRLSVTVEDARYQVLAHAEWEGSMDPVREATLSAGTTPAEVIRRCQVDGIIDQLHKTSRPFLFRGYADFQMRDRIVSPVKVSGDTVGYVDVLGGGRAFTPLDMRTAEHAATIIALHILRQQSVAEVEARVRHSFVDALLGGYFAANDAEWMDRARLFGFDPSRSHVVIIVGPLVHSGSARGRALEGRHDYQARQRIRDAVQAGLALCDLPQFITCSLNRVVMFLPVPPAGAGSLRRQVERVHQRVQAELGKLTVSMMCGGVHAGIAGLRRSFEEAEILTELQAPRRPLMWYQDCLVLQMVNGVADPRLLEDLVQATLSRLQAHPSGDMLVQTVEALVSCNFRQTLAAKRLHVHRNTLLYRLELIERLLDCALDDLETQVRLYLALRAREVLAGRRHGQPLTVEA